MSKSGEIDSVSDMMVLDETAVPLAVNNYEMNHHFNIPDRNVLVQNESGTSYLFYDSDLTVTLYKGYVYYLYKDRQCKNLYHIDYM